MEPDQFHTAGQFTVIFHLIEFCPDAAEHGTGEVIAAVSASALTNVVVFVPVMMMTTRIGSMMIPFAGVMVGATLVSLFISFTLTPILSCVLLKPQKKEEGKVSLLNKFFRPWDAGYDWLCEKFNRSIEWTARHAGIFLFFVVIGSAAVCVFIIPQVGLSFLPFCDQGEIRIKFEFPSNYNLATTEKLMKEVVEHLNKYDFIKAGTNSIVYRILHKYFTIWSYSVYLFVSAIS